MSDDLITTSGKRFVPKDFYPKFSWDKVPQYVMFADDFRLLRDSEITKISNDSTFVCVEKQHGSNKTQAFGCALKGLKHETERFKAIDPNIKVLGYFNACFAYTFCNDMKYFTKDEIDNYPDLKDYLLADRRTNELHSRGPTLFFNVTNARFRDWWSDKIISYLEESGADGYFIDQTHGLADYFPRNERGHVADCVVEQFQQLRSKMPSDKVLFINNGALKPRLFDFADAFMYEHWRKEEHTKEKLLDEWSMMEKIADAGKMVVIRFGASPEPDHFLYQHRNRPSQVRTMIPEWAELSKQQCTYYLAAYLIGAQPYSYFQWGWGFGLTTGPMENYPELAKPLGRPLGKYSRVNPDKWEFTREFEHASVWIDTDNREAKIEWKSNDGTVNTTRSAIANPSICPAGYHTWTPSTLPNVNLWLDASDRETIHTEDGKFVSKWKDKSGNNYDALQQSSKAQPFLTENALNGVNTVTFSRCQFFYNDTFSNGDWRDVYIVGHWTGPETFTSCNGLFTAANNKSASDEQSIGIIGRQGTTRLWPTNWWDDLYINGCKSGGEVGTLEKLSKPFILSFSSNDEVCHQGYCLGCDRRVQPTMRGWEGQIAEVISFSSILSPADRERVEGYLAHKWFGPDESNTLPNDHKYKSTSPT